MILLTDDEIVMIYRSSFESGLLNLEARILEARILEG